MKTCIGKVRWMKDTNMEIFEDIVDDIQKPFGLMTLTSGWEESQCSQLVNVGQFEHPSFHSLERIDCDEAPMPTRKANEEDVNLLMSIHDSSSIENFEEGVGLPVGEIDMTTYEADSSKNYAIREIDSNVLKTPPCKKMIRRSVSPIVTSP